MNRLKFFSFGSNRRCSYGANDERREKSCAKSVGDSPTREDLIAIEREIKIENNRENISQMNSTDGGMHMFCSEVEIRQRYLFQTVKIQRRHFRKRICDDDIEH